MSRADTHRVSVNHTVSERNQDSVRSPTLPMPAPLGQPSNANSPCPPCWKQSRQCWPPPAPSLGDTLLSKTVIFNNYDTKWPCRVIANLVNPNSKKRRRAIFVKGHDYADGAYPVHVYLDTFSRG